MVEKTPEVLDTLFQALCDPTRRAMLQALSERTRSVSELAAPFPMSLAAASKHLKILERAGLIRREIHGRTHLCRLEAAPLARLDAWLCVYEKVGEGPPFTRPDGS